MWGRAEEEEGCRDVKRVPQFLCYLSIRSRRRGHAGDPEGRYTPSKIEVPDAVAISSRVT